MRAAAMEEEERRDWRGSFLADSDDEQDGAEPANGPWNSTTIPRYRRRISHDIMIQKIPTIRALKFRSWAAHHCLWLCSGYFRGVCTPLTEVSGRVGLRSAHCGDLYVPTTRSELGKRSFCVAAARIWNSLPLRLHSFTISRERFRARLKTHLFMCTYTWLASENYWGVYLLTYLLTYLLNGLHVDALSVLTASIRVNGASDITSVQTTPPAVRRARMTSWLPEDRYVCRVTFLFTCLAFIRYWRRRRLMFKWTFCVFIFVLFPFFFWCDCSATAGRIFAKCSHQQTSLWCYLLKVKGIGDFVMRQHSDML